MYSWPFQARLASVLKPGYIIGVTLSEPHMNVKSGAGMRCLLYIYYIYYFVSIVRPPLGGSGTSVTFSIQYDHVPCSAEGAARLPIKFRIYTWRSISTLCARCTCSRFHTQREHEHGYHETLRIKMVDCGVGGKEREPIALQKAAEQRERKLRHRCEWDRARRVKIACQ